MLFWILLVRVIPPIAFALPLYIMMNKFGLLNTKVPVIMAHILVNIPFIIWFMMGFFSGLPEEVEESAEIDGASDLQLFARIVVPLVMPGITAVAILSFMTSWTNILYASYSYKAINFTIPLSLSTQQRRSWPMGKHRGGRNHISGACCAFRRFYWGFLSRGCQAGSQGIAL